MLPGCFSGPLLAFGGFCVGDPASSRPTNHSARGGETGSGESQTHGMASGTHEEVGAASTSLGIVQEERLLVLRQSEQLLALEAKLVPVLLVPGLQQVTWNGVPIVVVWQEKLQAVFESMEQVLRGNSVISEILPCLLQLAASRFQASALQRDLQSLQGYHQTCRRSCQAESE